MDMHMLSTWLMGSAPSSQGAGACSVQGTERNVYRTRSVFFVFSRLRIPIKRIFTALFTRYGIGICVLSSEKLTV